MPLKSDHTFSLLTFSLVLSSECVTALLLSSCFNHTAQKQILHALLLCYRCRAGQCDGGQLGAREQTSQCTRTGVGAHG